MGVLAVLGSDSVGDAQVAKPVAAAPWSMRGAWFLQQAVKHCDPGSDQVLCSLETTHVLVLLICLVSAIVFVFCLFTFFRDDKEEQITPLCPGLIVKDTELRFRLRLDQEDHMEVVAEAAVPYDLCQVNMEWPDPFRPGANGVVAEVQVVSNMGTTLASVIARNVMTSGTGLLLTRSGLEIFGFVELEGTYKYHIRHRTGVHLLTLLGDFKRYDLEGYNPVGLKVCSIKRRDDGWCQVKVGQYVDAGLVLCALLAAYVEQRIRVPPPSWDPATSPGRPFPPPVRRDLAWAGHEDADDVPAGRVEVGAEANAAAAGAAAPDAEVRDAPAPDAAPAAPPDAAPGGPPAAPAGGAP